jgi:hypothetical protein
MPIARGIVATDNNVAAGSAVAYGICFIEFGSLDYRPAAIHRSCREMDLWADVVAHPFSAFVIRPL